ncbi:MAG: GntR family transcriptional regulator [Alphaproteobacteria bacterium]
MNIGISAQPAQQRSAPDLIAAVLRDAIFDGRLPSGTPLKQAEVATHFGVSAIPVREAFQKLVAEGLAVLHRNRGVVVAPLSEADLIDIAELRTLLESRALRLSAPHLGGADLMEAEDTLSRAHTVEGNGAQAALHWRFHQILYAKANRPRLLAEIDTLFVHMNRYVMTAWRAPWLDRDWDDSHRAITAALRKSDTESAVRLIVEQIQDATDRVLRHLRAQEKRDA